MLIGTFLCNAHQGIPLREKLKYTHTYTYIHTHTHTHTHTHIPIPRWGDFSANYGHQPTCINIFK